MATNYRPPMPRPPPGPPGPPGRAPYIRGTPVKYNEASPEVIALSHQNFVRPAGMPSIPRRPFGPVTMPTVPGAALRTHYLTPAQLAEMPVRHGGRRNRKTRNRRNRTQQNKRNKTQQYRRY